MRGMREKVQVIARLAKENAPASACQVDVIELVNWVYAVQRAHQVDGRGIGLEDSELIAEGILPADRAGGGSLWAGFETLLRLGVFVDGTGGWNGELHPVARAVNELVIGLGWFSSGLIIRYAARCDVPPGASAEEPRLGPSWKGEPLHDHRGRPRPRTFKIEYDEHRQEWLCPLALDHEPDYVEQLRAEYRAWHDALATLATRSAASVADLRGAIIMPPKTPREPWLTVPNPVN